MKRLSYLLLFLVMGAFFAPQASAAPTDTAPVLSVVPSTAYVEVTVPDGLTGNVVVAQYSVADASPKQIATSKPVPVAGPGTYRVDGVGFGIGGASAYKATLSDDQGKVLLETGAPTDFATLTATLNYGDTGEGTSLQVKGNDAADIVKATLRTFTLAGNDPANSSMLSSQDLNLNGEGKYVFPASPLTGSGTQFMIADLYSSNGTLVRSLSPFADESFSAAEASPTSPTVVDADQSASKDKSEDDSDIGQLVLVIAVLVAMGALLGTVLGDMRS